MVSQLQKYPKVFTVSKVDVTINEALKSPEERNKAVEMVLLDLKKQNLFEALLHRILLQLAYHLSGNKSNLNQL